MVISRSDQGFPPRRTTAAAFAPVSASAFGTVFPSAPVSLLDALAVEYPEVSGLAVANALDQAAEVADALGNSPAASTAGSARILTLARDRLDAIQARAAATRRGRLTAS